MKPRTAGRIILADAVLLAALVMVWPGMWRWHIVAAVAVAWVVVMIVIWPDHDCGVPGCPIRNNAWHDHANRRPPAH